MDALTFAAIMAGSQALGGMMKGKAERERALTEAQTGAAAQEAKLLQDSFSRQAQEQQASLGNLIDAYRTALL